MYAGAELTVVALRIHLEQPPTNRPRMAIFIGNLRQSAHQCIQPRSQPTIEGLAAFDFTPSKGGQYQVTATGEEHRAATRTRSALFLYAAGDDFVAWPRQNNDRIELVADKKRYAPGETANILVPNPFVGAVKALVTVERSGVLESRVVEFTDSSETLEVR
jgi:uncharacterized protein YfaS (alpha-2-macroglobulin family)